MKTPTVSSLDSEIKQARKIVTARRAELSVLEGDMAKATAALDETRAAATMAGDAILLGQSFSGSIQTGVIGQFEDLLTRAIRQIFGRDYEVHIEIAAKGNSLWADFRITLPNGNIVSLTDGEGGGLKDIVAVMSRILYLVLDPTQPARIMFLDENLKHLDGWRSPAAFPIIIKIARELGIQIVWITHSPAVVQDGGELGIDGVYRFSLVDDATVADKVVKIPTEAA